MPTHASLLPYGVHVEPKLSREGWPILCAVGNGGREVKRVRVKPGDDMPEVKAQLHNYLLDADPPQRHLKVV